MTSRSTTLTVPIERQCCQHERDIAYDEAGDGKGDALIINREKWRQNYTDMVWRYDRDGVKLVRNTGWGEEFHCDRKSWLECILLLKSVAVLGDVNEEHRVPSNQRSRTLQTHHHHHHSTPSTLAKVDRVIVHCGRSRGRRRRRAGRAGGSRVALRPRTRAGAQPDCERQMTSLRLFA